MKTIKELYREGKYNIWGGNKKIGQANEIEERFEEFLKELDPKKARVLEDLWDDLLVQIDAEAEDAFSEGFSLGVRLIAESFGSDKSNND